MQYVPLGSRWILQCSLLICMSWKRIVLLDLRPMLVTSPVSTYSVFNP